MFGVVNAVLLAPLRILLPQYLVRASYLMEIVQHAVKR